MDRLALVYAPFCQRAKELFVLIIPVLAYIQSLINLIPLRIIVGQCPLGGQLDTARKRLQRRMGVVPFKGSPNLFIRNVEVNYAPGTKVRGIESPRLILEIVEEIQHSIRRQQPATWDTGQLIKPYLSHEIESRVRRRRFCSGLS